MRSLHIPSLTVVLVGCVLAAIVSASAQTVAPDPMSMGRTYVLAFPDTVGNERVEVFADTRLNDAAIVAIYSPVPNRITITGGNGIARWSGIVDSARFTTVDLMALEFRDPYGPLSPNPAVQRKNAFRLQAEHPVFVYCHLQTVWGSEAWTPLPVEAWGTEYYAAAFPGDVVRNVYTNNRNLVTKAQAAPSEIVIVAAYDNTLVEVVPNGAVVGSRGLITLRANEAYQVRSHVDTAASAESTQPDLGGSYIHSNKPIGVISGNTRTAIIDERGGLTKNSLKGMALEWLAPADAHGQSMVYTPVIDELRVLGTKGEPVATKRPGELLRIFGTWTPGTRAAMTAPGDASVPFTVSPATFQQFRFDGPLGARYITSDGPIQGMSAPAGVIRAASASGGGYDTWSAFLTELVPREQWTSFAPFYALGSPAGTRHYINVVTDSLSANDIWLDGRRLRLSMGKISGSDLVWGSIEVSTSFVHWLEGRNGAKFTATMYGLLAGVERRVGFYSYRENIALSYGMALGPARRALRLRDSLVVDTTRACRTMTVDITTAGGTIETVRSVSIDSASNVRLVPESAASGPMITPARMRLEVIDPQRDAGGTLAIEDRMGRVVRIPYVRAGELVTVEPATGLAFGEAMSGDTVVRDLTLRNRSSVPVSLSSVRFATGRLRLALVDTIDGQTIAPGASLTLRVRAVPMGAVGVHGDSVIVALNCMEVGVSASVTIVEPCIEVSDVDFGVVTPGSFVSRTLQLCNRGRGRLQLKALAGDTAILWEDPAFSINPVFLEQLRTSTLGPSECMSVEVFFLSMKDGTYRTVAHVEPSAGVCRDSSRWTAVVSPAGAVDPAGVGDAALDATIDGRRVTLECDGPGRVVVYDLVGRRVAGPFTVETPRRAVEWDASNLPAGVYYCLFARASGIAVAPVILR